MHLAGLIFDFEMKLANKRDKPRDAFEFSNFLRELESYKNL